MKLEMSCVVWPLVFTAALAPTRHAAGDEHARRRFLTEYPPAARKLEAFYRNLRMVAFEREPLIRFNRDNDPPTVEVNEWRTRRLEFLANGSSLRLDSSIEGQTPPHSVVKTPGLSFSVKRDSETSAYRMTNQSVQSAEGDSSYEWRIRNSAPIAFMPYGCPAGAVSDFMADDFTLKEIEQTESPDGQVAVRVDWEKTYPPHGESLRGSFTFLPESSWALQHIVFLTPSKHPRTGEAREMRTDFELEYEGERDGIPLVKGMQQWRGGPDKKDLTSTTSEVMRIDPGPVPKDEFTLAAFGLRTDPAPQPVPVMYYLLALAAACGLLVIVLNYLRRRSERSFGPA